MLRFLYDKYGMIILFILSVVALIAIFIYNVFSGKKGTFQDHTQMMWKLFSMKSGKPEPVFRESAGEVECRRVAEKLTGLPFPKQRPNFLKNTVTGSNLEIDCFNSQLKVGVEYNGRQHYEHVPYFHSSKDAFYSTKYRDEMKQRLCEENGIKLIVVPYTVPVGQIESFLKTKFKEHNIIR